MAKVRQFLQPKQKEVYNLKLQCNYYTAVNNRTQASTKLSLVDPRASHIMR